MIINYKQGSREKILLTKNGFEEIKRRLEDLRKERCMIHERFKLMDPHDKTEGILYENEIMQVQQNEEELNKVIEIIQNAKLIRKRTRAANAIRLGSHVEIKLGGKVSGYTLVSSLEVDPSEHKISEDSPLGKMLIGRKINDGFRLTTPKGLQKFCHILSVE